MTDPAHHRRHGILWWLRSSFLTGLVVVLPIGLTIYLIWVVIGWIDAWVLPLIPAAWQPDALMKDWFGPEANYPTRGIGVVVFLVFTVIVGWIARGLIGRSVIGWAEGVVGRMPVIRSVYTGLKQIAETVFSQGKPTFDRACLVEFPRTGMWSVGFLAGEARGEIGHRLGPGNEMLSVYLPTTPNPTSGYIVFVRRSEVIPLDMTIEDAAKLIISAGLVYPADLPPALRAPASGSEAASQP
jgi:uncharacterized membrane protein